MRWHSARVPLLLVSLSLDLCFLAAAVSVITDRTFQPDGDHRVYLESQPVTRALRQIRPRKAKRPELRNILSGLRGLSDDQEKAINGSKPPPRCSEQHRTWAAAARKFLVDHRLPLPTSPCPYVISYSGRSEEDPGRTLEAATVLSSYAAQFQNALRAAPVNFRKWPAKFPTFFMFFKVRVSESYNCRLSVDCVIEVNPKGPSPERYFVTLVQSFNPRHGAETHVSILEVVSTDLSRAMARRRDPKNESVSPCMHSSCERFSTIFQKSKGRGTFSHLIPMKVHEVPLLDSTLEENEDKFSVANSILEDLTPSNIAILALPLVLCFIPISPMADVSNTATLVYALITDLFSAVPLIIKGAELMVKFNQNPRTTHSETWIFGNDQIRISEIWSTKCKISISRSTGLVIVAVAVWAIVLGFATEYLSWRYVSYKKKNQKHYAVLQDRNYIRKVGPDTYQVRSKYLAKMLDGTSARGSSSSPPFPSSSAPHSAATSLVAPSLDGLVSHVTSRSTVPGPHASVDITTLRSCTDDDLPLDEFPMRARTRSSRISSIFLRNSILSDEEEFPDQLCWSFFLGVFLGLLLPGFSYCYLHCLGDIERSRKRRKFYGIGCVIGLLLWGPLLYLAQLLYFEFSSLT